MTTTRTTREERDWVDQFAVEGDYRKPVARTLADAFPEPDWRTGWQSAESAVAQEDHIRAMFNNGREPDAWRLPHLFIYAIGAVFAVLFVLGFFN